MKKILLILTVFGIVGCATTPEEPVKDFRAISAAPYLEQLIDEGNCWAACSNAWQGYTPPRKTVTKCRYDTFGNVITGTCTTQ